MFEDLDRQARRLAQRVKRGSRVAIANVPGRLPLLRATAQRLGDSAVLVHVPRDPDKTAYVLLTVAAQCGKDALEKTAAHLAAHPSDPTKALHVLGGALGQRRLIVDDLDAIESSAGDTELREVFASTLKQVQEWLRNKASILTSLQPSEKQLEYPRLQEPRPNPNWDSELLWKRVGQDVDLYTLAIARSLLLGISPNEQSLTWDADSIIGDLWRGMPLELRELITTLAIHGRAISRAQAQKLGLFSATAIDIGLASNIVEESRGTLWLTATPLWLNLLPQTTQRERHQQLADAFAQLARATGTSSTDPIAVLEAHRHYTAIPDVDRAREFARFGVSQLLSSAKRLSFESLSSKAAAARTYEVVLQLDEQLRVSGEIEGIGKRARAYAIHYRAYNRYKTGADDPLVTLSAYREALTLWRENALFWSRTIRCCFVADLYEDGMRARDDALAAVLPHPLRAQFIIGRTVERLLRRKLVLAAVLVWRDHQAETMVEKDVQRQLFERIGQGWLESRLWVRGFTPLSLTHPTNIRITRHKQVFTCNLLGYSSQGNSPERALSSGVQGIFSEVASLVEEANPSPVQIQRKRDLTSALDLRALQMQDELARWVAHLASLDERVENSDITSEQQKRFLETWKRARESFPHVRRPAVGQTDDGKLYLSWSFTDRPHVSLIIYIERDGRYDWFFRNALQNDVRGTDEEPLHGLPSEAVDLLAAFTS